MSEEGEQKQRLSDIHLEPYAHTDDKSDKVAYLRSQEQERRELRVAKSRAMIARKAVSDCYEKEGVNHYQNCREVVEHYLDLIWRKDKYGMLQPPSAAAADA
jgi:NADH-ubiquinone oxidoreductase subunit 10